MSLLTILPLTMAVQPTGLLWASSAVAGLAVVLLLFAIVSVMTARRNDQTFDSFERGRRNRLRRTSRTYRWLEPLIDEAARLNRQCGSPGLRDKLRQRLELLSGVPPWKPEEFLAVRQVEGVAVGALCLSLGMFAGWPIALLLGGGGLWGYPWLMRMSVADRAAGHVRTFKKRLPYAIDMMALMMESGASFHESLETAVRENQDQPVGQELGTVACDVTLGRSRREALQALNARLDDQDVREIVFAVVQGEELGTPLSRIFSIQADQLRLRRSQMAEKSAAEAQVRMVFPGMLIMLACLLIVVAPFLLKFTAFL